MTYQPLYATMNDNIGIRTTHSRRGRIDGIDYWLNSRFGEVLTVISRTSGALTKKDVYEAEQKIKEWTEKGSINRATQWKEKLKERKDYNNAQEKEEFVQTNIHIKHDKRYTYSLNYVKLTPKVLQVLEIMNQKPETVESFLSAHEL